MSAAPSPAPPPAPGLSRRRLFATTSAAGLALLAAGCTSAPATPPRDRVTDRQADALAAQVTVQEGVVAAYATVTAALPPPGLEVEALRRLLAERHGVVVAGGQGKMSGKMVRVGHLGAVAEGDVVQVIWAMEQALEELDVAPADGRGVAAVTASVQGVPATAR